MRCIQSHPLIYLTESHNIAGLTLDLTVDCHFPVSWDRLRLQVQEDDYGLTTNDIVSLSDKDLNQLVGLRNLAPYRDAYNQKKGRRDTIHRLKALKAKPTQVRGPKLACSMFFPPGRGGGARTCAITREGGDREGHCLERGEGGGRGAAAYLASKAWLTRSREDCPEEVSKYIFSQGRAQICETKM